MPSSSQPNRGKNKLRGASGYSGRSPGYPTITLENAIRRIHRVLNYSPSGLVAKSEIHKSWDAPTAAGKIMSYVASLRYYGLTDEVGPFGQKTVQVTQWGRDLTSRKASRELLIRAALTPRVFFEVWQNFKTAVHLDSRKLTTLLVAERRARGEIPFSDKGVEEVYRIYRANVIFTGLTDDEKIAVDNEGTIVVGTSLDETVVRSSSHGSRIATERRSDASIALRFRLKSGRDALLRLPAQINPTDADQIAAFLSTDYHNRLKELLLASETGASAQASAVITRSVGKPTQERVGYRWAFALSSGQVAELELPLAATDEDRRLAKEAFLRTIDKSMDIPVSEPDKTE